MFSQLTVPFLDAGGAVHIVDFGSAEQAADALRAGATFICLIPWLGYLLMEHFREHPPRDLSLRVCLVGADRVPRDFFSEFEKLTGVIPAEILGMTETNVYAVNRLIEGNLRLGSVGQAFPDSEIQTRDARGRAVETGVSGEIWVKTPMAMAGYWQDPEQTRRAMSDGWVATGDAGYLDADGFLWFTGRLKHLIICDGDNVYPKEVENAIGQHPVVNQVCVVGLPHETRGETVGAAVTVNDSHTLTLEELETFLEDKLAETKIPTKLLVLDQLPQTSTGKLDHAAVASSLYRAQSP
jgi:acyl-CoA synthetase (AMP-forming)/AMP-acid ligase II